LKGSNGDENENVGGFNVYKLEKVKKRGEIALVYKEKNER
jgi:hypothetical protein